VANAIRVLFVEDDRSYRETLAGEPSEQGFAVESFADGASLLDSLDVAVDAHIFILDWKLPKTPGIDLLHQLRRHGVNLPVVFLTGYTLPADESLALQKGAIDFIDKARGVEVLVRRLRRVTSRRVQAQRSCIRRASAEADATLRAINLATQFRSRSIKLSGPKRPFCAAYRATCRRPTSVLLPSATECAGAGSDLRS
jgi:DNA-binding response OmpR family regulator